MILSKISQLLPSKLKYLHAKIFGTYSTASYSQEGEDIVLKRIFNQKKIGFYVDVGAHHPIRFSNTYTFYQQGWTGINIEPNPDSFSMFKKYRAKDINVNCGVATEKGSFNYYMFDESALNTFDNEVLKSRIANTSYNHIKTLNVKVLPLTEVFRLYLPKDKKIDFLTVDVEGLDLQVLKSNDWVKYRPSWVLAEQLELDNIENLSFEIHVYMKSQNYILFAKTFNTLFYKDKSVLL